MDSRSQARRLPDSSCSRCRRRIGLHRNRNDWTRVYPGIVAAAGKLKCRSAIIDGEVIFPDPEGRSDFHAIRTVIGSKGRGLVFVAFDLPFLDGRDLRWVPLEERRALLRELIPGSAKSCLQF